MGSKYRMFCVELSHSSFGFHTVLMHVLKADLDDVRMGMRVQAVWKDEIDGEQARGFGAAIEHWEPTGEPDVDPDHFKEHLL